MVFELRTIPGCPNSAPALELFRAALHGEGLNPDAVMVLELSSEVAAAALNFNGSPSFLAGGRDLFPSPAAAGLTCRLYAAGQGVSGLPTMESLRTAVRALGAGA